MQILWNTSARKTKKTGSTWTRSDGAILTGGVNLHPVLAVAPRDTHHLENFSFRERFAENVVAAVVQDLHPKVVIGLARGDDHRRRRGKVLGVFQQFCPRTVGKLGLANQDNGNPFLQRGQSLRDRGGLDQSPAAVLQDAAQSSAVSLRGYSKNRDLSSANGLVRSHDRLLQG